MALISDESRVLIIYTGGTIGMLVSDTGYVPEPFFLFETLRSQTSRFHDPHGDSLLSQSRSVKGFREWSETHSREESRSRGVSRERRATPDTIGGGKLKPLGEALASISSEEGRGRPSDGARAHTKQKSFPLDSPKIPPSPAHTDLPFGLHGPPTLLVRSTRPVKVPPYILDGFETVDGKEHPLKSCCVKVKENCYEVQLPSLVTPATGSVPGGNVKRIRYAVLEVRYFFQSVMR